MKLLANLIYKTPDFPNRPIYNYKNRSPYEQSWIAASNVLTALCLFKSHSENNINITKYDDIYFAYEESQELIVDHMSLKKILEINDDNTILKTFLINTILSHFSILVLSLDVSFLKKFGRNSNIIKGKNIKSDLDKIRFIINNVRNGFAHSPMKPMWDIKKNKRINFDLYGVKYDFNILNGKIIEPIDFGEFHGLYNIIVRSLYFL